MMFNDERKRQLELYSDYLKPIKVKKIDYKIAVESFVMNLKKGSDRNTEAIIFSMDGINCMHYVPQLCTLYCDVKLQTMVLDFGFTSKVCETVLRALMNRHHNISKIAYISFLKF